MSPLESTDGKRVLVLGDYRQTIVVVRSLARAGYIVTLGSSNPLGSTALSRHVSGVWIYDDNGNEHFHSQLECYLKRATPDFVFVVGESQLRSLAPAAPRFESLAVWVMPAWQTAERCLDKNAMYAQTSRLGIPTMDWSEFTDTETWRRAAHGMGYPVVVKRRDSSALIRGHKAMIFGTPETFETFLAGLAAESDCGSLLLQKFAPGRRHNCHFGAAAGKLVAYFEQKVLRTDELDYTGIGIEGISVTPSPLLRAYCTQLVDSLDYNGIGCIQFLVDEISGKVAFLELNPRMDSTAALPYHLDYDFPKLAIDLAHDPALCAAFPLTSRYRCGVRYHWLYGDLLSWHDAWRQRQRSPAQLLAWACRSTLTAVCSYHLTWDAYDPLPTLHLYWTKLFRSVAKGFVPQDPIKAHTL